MNIRQTADPSNFILSIEIGNQIASLTRTLNAEFSLDRKIASSLSAQQQLDVSAVYYKTPKSRCNQAKRRTTFLKQASQYAKE